MITEYEIISYLYLQKMVDKAKAYDKLVEYIRQLKQEKYDLSLEIENLNGFINGR